MKADFSVSGNDKCVRRAGAEAFGALNADLSDGIFIRAGGRLRRRRRLGGSMLLFFELRRDFAAMGNSGKQQKCGNWEHRPEFHTGLAVDDIPQAKLLGINAVAAQKFRRRISFIHP